MRFALFFLPAAFLLTIAVAAYIDADSSLNLKITKVREAARVENAHAQIAQDFREVITDLRVLAEMPDLLHYLDGGSRAQHDDLSRHMLVIAKEARRYDQLRYIDIKGKEVVRINFNAGQPVIVPQSDLQDKSTRYFFRDTIKLGRGEVYVSPLDLNIEHGEIEQPFKPMIRFGTPVFDSKGRKRGVLMINYFGQDAIEHFLRIMSGGDPRRAMLLNRDGYWLSAPDVGDEWGFMFGRADKTFGHRHPQEWREIASKDNGDVETDEGLFVYDTVYPLQAELHSSSGSPLPHVPSSHEIASSEYYWKVISFVSKHTLQERALYRKPIGILALFGAYLLLAIGMAIIAHVTLGRERANRELQARERRLSEITNTMSDGLLVMDQGGRITFANPEALSLLGYSMDELLGGDMHEMLHVRPDGTPEPRAECRMLKVKQTGATYRGEEETFRCKDGSILPLSVSASVIVREGKVNSIVVAFHDITLRKQLELELERRAQTDALTGLSNRRHFYELAESELLRSRRYAAPMAVLMLDLDYFKLINDTHGHHAGDEVLKSFSQTCLQTLREIDVVARIGGEEFAVLMPETSAEQGLEVAERLRVALAESVVVVEGGERLHFTVSIGATCLCAGDQNIDEVLKRADEALYQAKHAGRNTVRMVAARQ
ncbi:MAG: diguanylate cyclase [Pseudomonadota bacterium]